MMKKVLLPLTLLLAFSVGTGFASPINNLVKDQTAVGIMLHTDENSFYIENKVTDTLTAGYEQIHMNHMSINDFHAQFDTTQNAKVLLGFRDFDSSSRAYAGLALTAPLNADATGYTSLIAGNRFTELQVGINYRLADGYDLNLNYRAFNYQHFNDVTTIGVSYKF